MKNIVLNKNLLFVVFFTVILSCKIFPQFGSSGTTDARSMGLAKTYNSTSMGIYSLGINPANLSIMEEGSVEFSTVFPLPFVSFHSGTDFLTIESLNYFFGGVDGKARVLTDEDKRNFNELFSGGGFAFTSFSVRLLSLAWKPNLQTGTFALSISDFAGANLTIPQAVVDLGLNGNQPGKKYNLSDEKLSSWWIRNYSISYSREFLNESDSWLKNILTGVSLKLVHGYYYAGIEKVNTNFETRSYNEIHGSADMIGYSAFSDGFGVKYNFDSTNHKSSSFGPFMPPAGNGFGFDVGISFMLENNWNFALALTDIGRINWTKNTAKFTAQGEIFINDLTDQNQLDSLKNKLTGDAEKIESFSTGLPTAFRFGLGLILNEEDNLLPGTLLLGLDYNQGFNDLPGNSKTPRISFGFEWKPGDWIPYLRSGVSIGGADELAWALGLGINTDIIEFNFATSYFQSIVSPNSAKQVSIAFGSRWKF
jgi:hypothetical protein